MRIPAYLDSVFVLDPAAGLTAGNLWRDSGPHRLDVTPQAGFVAPNYGIVLGPSGAPCIRFTGAANVYGLMSGAAQARFYAVAPTTAMTLAIVARHTTPAVSNRIFYARNAGATRGIFAAYMGASAERINLYGYDAAATACIVQDTANVPLTGRTRISSYSESIADTTMRYVWHDGQGYAATVAGAAAAIAYDTTIVPVVGAATGGGFPFVGDLYFMGLWPRTWSLAEYQAFYRYWADRI